LFASIDRPFLKGFISSLHKSAFPCVKKKLGELRISVQKMYGFARRRVSMPEDSATFSKMLAIQI
jgi:hypothetical protein